MRTIRKIPAITVATAVALGSISGATAYAAEKEVDERFVLAADGDKNEDAPVPPGTEEGSEGGENNSEGEEDETSKFIKTYSPGDEISVDFSEQISSEKGFELSLGEKSLADHLNENSVVIEDFYKKYSPEDYGHWVADKDNPHSVKWEYNKDKTHLPPSAIITLKSTDAESVNAKSVLTVISPEKGIGDAEDVKAEYNSDDKTISFSPGVTGVPLSSEKLDVTWGEDGKISSVKKLEGKGLGYAQAYFPALPGDENMTVTPLKEGAEYGTVLEVKGEGEYTIDPKTNTIKFEPAEGFEGAPKTPIPYVVVDILGVEGIALEDIQIDIEAEKVLSSSIISTSGHISFDKENEDEDSQAIANPLSYEAGMVGAGQTVELEQKNKNIPEGVKFVVEDNSNGAWKVSVNNENGTITATAPQDAKSGDTVRVTVVGTYPDGSTSKFTTTILVLSGDDVTPPDNNDDNNKPTPPQSGDDNDTVTTPDDKPVTNPDAGKNNAGVNNPGYSHPQGNYTGGFDDASKIHVPSYGTVSGGSSVGNIEDPAQGVKVNTGGAVEHQTLWDKIKLIFA